MSKYEQELNEAIELVEQYAGYGVADDALLTRVSKAAAHLKREVLQTARWVKRVSVLERRLGVIRAMVRGEAPPLDLGPMELDTIGLLMESEPGVRFDVEKVRGGTFTVVASDVAGNRASLGNVIRLSEVQAHWVRERFAEAYKLSVEEEL